MIEKYATDLKTKCKINPEMDLLTKVTIACGPYIYNKDASIVSASDPSEIRTIRNNFLIKKLGLHDISDFNTAINTVIDVYGQSSRNKYLVVVYYLLTKHFGRVGISELDS